MLLTQGIIGLSLLGQGALALRLWNTTDGFSSDLPWGCQRALTRDIACQNYLVTAQDASNGAALPPSLAKEYCTQECRDSIDGFQRAAHLACGNKSYKMFANSTVRAVPGDIANGLMWAYQLNCIQDSSGYCLADFYARKKSACSSCTLQYGAIMMNTDYGRKKFPPAAYSSLLSSCGVPESSYTYSYTPSVPSTTSESPNGTSSAGPTPTPTCTGKTYVSTQGDTCESISKSQSISTDRLVEINNLDYACKSLVPGTNLCIDKTCETYTVKANETCQSIVKGQKFGMVQLIGWNPTIHQNCDNFGSMVGRSICISPPGGGGFSLPDTNITTSKGLPSSMFSNWLPATPTVMTSNISTSWYWPTLDPSYTLPPMTMEPNATWASLMAQRTQYCWLKDEQFNTFDPDSDDVSPECSSLFESYCDLGPTDPVPKSPESPIPQTCTPTTTTEEPEPSTTATPTSTGIATPTPTQSGMVMGCNKFYKVQKDDGCQKIADNNHISNADFLAWNPDVGPDCRNLKYDYYVCVGRDSTSTTPASTTTPTGIITPTPTQTGMVAGCDQFHKVEKGEGCQAILDHYGISLANFAAWNPDVGNDCRNLKYDFYACVGIKSPSGTSATTTTTNTNATPTPTQDGMVSGCKKFHKVEQGEWCAKIADENYVSLSDFLAWNPDVGAQCGNLKYDFYVCVGK